MKQQQQPAGGTPELVHNEGASRYELRIDGELAAQAQYTREGQALRFTHTEVDPKREGQGLGSRLATFALDDVRTRGLKAVPQCKFIAGYIARHEKEYGSLVAAG
jgi:predicted GNAT family acetyltransferase